MAGERTIVVAWVEARETFDLRTRRHASERVAHACCWLRRGGDDDERAARAHAATLENGRVLTYPVDEPEALERARRESLAAWEADQASGSVDWHNVTRRREKDEG